MFYSYHQLFIRSHTFVLAKRMENVNLRGPVFAYLFLLGRHPTLIGPQDVLIYRTGTSMIHLGLPIPKEPLSCKVIYGLKHELSLRPAFLVECLNPEWTVSPGPQRKYLTSNICIHPRYFPILVRRGKPWHRILLRLRMFFTIKSPNDIQHVTRKCTSLKHRPRIKCLFRILSLRFIGRCVVVIRYSIKLSSRSCTRHPCYRFDPRIEHAAELSTFPFSFLHRLKTYSNGAVLGGVQQDPPPISASRRAASNSSKVVPATPTGESFRIRQQQAHSLTGSASDKMFNTNCVESNTMIAASVNDELFAFVKGAPFHRRCLPS